MPYADPEDRKRYAKRWREKNKEQIASRSREFRNNNREKIKEDRKRRVAASPESYRDKRRDTPEGVEKQRARHREYEATKRVMTPERIAAAEKWRQDNNEYLKQYQRQKRIDNPEKAKRQAKESYLRHIDQRREDQANYRLRNPEKVKQQVRDWIKNNPDKARKMWSRRRVAKRNAPMGDLDLIAEWDKYWRHQESVPCFWCGERGPGNKYHADHVVPITKGGAHDVSNLVISCPDCNLRKKNMMPDKWLVKLRKIEDDRRKNREDIRHRTEERQGGTETSRDS